MPSWWVSQLKVMFNQTELCLNDAHNHPDAYFLTFRFDIYGLSSEAEEDEAGIKRASESSEFLKTGENFVWVFLMTVAFDNTIFKLFLF